VIAVKFCVALLGFWTLRGYASEGRGLVKAALELPEIHESDLAKAHALYVGAGLAESQSDYVEACGMLESCLELRRGLGRPLEIAITLSTLSLARLRRGDAALASVGENEALRIFRELGERVDEGIALLHLGQIAHYIGEDGQAITHLQESLDMARETENPEVEGECLLMLGRCALEARDFASAAHLLLSSLAVCSKAADKRGMANAHWWLGKVDLERGNLEPARRFLVDAIAQFRAFEMWEEVLGCLEDHAMLMYRDGAGLLAVQVSAVTSKMRQRLNLARAPRVEARWQSHLNRLHESLMQVDYAAEWAVGWDQLEVDDAIRMCISTPVPV
jgi:tetratricopeptide (TPR) repeat protein